MMFTVMDIKAAIDLIKLGMITVDDIIDADFKVAIQAQLTA